MATGTERAADDLYAGLGQLRELLEGRGYRVERFVLDSEIAAGFGLFVECVDRRFLTPVRIGPGPFRAVLALAMGLPDAPEQAKPSPFINSESED